MAIRCAIATALCATIIALASATPAKGGKDAAVGSYVSVSEELSVAHAPHKPSKKYSKKSKGHGTCVAEHRDCRKDRDCCHPGRLVCTDAPWEGRGKKLCLQAPPKCYRAGDRCIGAPGKPYVPYAPCCDAKLACMPYPKFGYGSFCVPVAHAHEHEHDHDHDHDHADGHSHGDEGAYEYIEYIGDHEHGEAHDDDKHGDMHDHKKPVDKREKPAMRPTKRPTTTTTTTARTVSTETSMTSRTDSTKPDKTETAYTNATDTTAKKV